MIKSHPNRSHTTRFGKALPILLLLLVVAGGAAAVWFFVLRGPGTPGAPSAEFDLVPRDATAFFTVRVADTSKTSLGQKALDAMKKDPTVPLGKLDDLAGLKLEDIERATIVIADPNKEKNLGWVIVHTLKAYDKDKIIKASESTEKEHKGKKYHSNKKGEKSRKDDAAFLFLSDKLFVMGTEEGIKKCLELPEKPAAGALDPHLTLASDKKNHIAMGGVNSQDAKDFAKKQSQGKLSQSALIDAKSAYMTANIGDKLTLTVGLEMPDADKAKAATEEVNKFLDAGKAAYTFMGKEMINGVMGANAKPVNDEVERVLADTKAKQDGSKVVVNANVDVGVLTKAIDAVAK